MSGPMAVPPHLANQLHAQAHLHASLTQFRLAHAKDIQMMLLSQSIVRQSEFQDELDPGAITAMALKAVAHTDALMAALGFTVKKATGDGELSDAP